MLEHQDRADRFRAEIAEMGLADPATARDRLLLRVGVTLMAVGGVLAASVDATVPPRAVTTRSVCACCS